MRMPRASRAPCSTAYLYFIPNSSVVNPFTGDYTKSGIVVRYDTKADFAAAAAAAWSPFDTGTLTPAARGFSGRLSTAATSIWRQT